MLADLSSLVKQAKRLQDVANGLAAVDSVEDLFDQMLYKAFRVVTRGVKFLDIWNEEVRAPMDFEQQLSMHSHFHNGPLTPPEESPIYPMPKLESYRSTGSFSSQAETVPRSSRGSVSTACSVQDPLSNMSSARGSVSHRMSYSSHHLTGAPRNPNLASERLTRAYDGFLGVLGSCIGLHMQSRDSPELIPTTQQAVKSSQILLATIQKIWDQDMHRSRVLEIAIEILNDRLAELVSAARDAFHPLRQGENASEGEAEYVYIPAKGGRVVQAVTDCVKGAGECVAKARYVLDRVGDFEIEPDQISEGINFSLDVNQDRDTDISSVDVTETDFEENENEAETRSVNEIQSSESAETITPASHLNSREAEAAPPAPVQPQEPQVPDNHSINETVRACKKSASREAMIYHVSNDSDSSMSLQTREAEITTRRRNDSTRSSIRSVFKAPLDLNKPLPPTIKPGSSSGESAHVDDDGEEILEKTFAHELMWKDGQVVGATLRALVEKLTAHEATPDAVFVSTIYLTFRSFSTPVTFTEEMMSRYDYISETPSIASPVRLRVYNFFKGWLETHWRDECDQPALPIIKDFAQNKLKLHLPSAGDRLLELCEKVAVMHSPVVPRMTSTIGRANNSFSSFSSPDTPLPSPSISRSQTSLLKQFKTNGAILSVLDFDPLEIARQLTLKCSTVFCSILPEELLNTEWMKKTSTLAVNVRAMSTLATDITHLVADTILSLEEPKKRAAVIKQWIKIAAKCLELNNYDTLMAIVCALNSSNISRLKRTWELLSSRTKDSFDKLHRIVDVSRNYSTLRRRLQNHVPPCLPFVGMYLTDLTFVDHGNQNTRCLRTENGSMDVINFDKYVKTARIISDFQRFQIPYKLIEVPELQAWIQENLLRVRDLGDQNFTHNWRRSISLEPRQTPNAAQEQQHYHILSSTEIKEKLEIFSRGQIGRKKSIPSADAER